MLGKTRDARRDGAGIGAKGDFYSGVVQGLYIGLVSCNCLFEDRNARAFQRLLQISRITELSFQGRLQRVLKEWFFGPSRLFRKDIRTFVQIKRGNIPNRPSFHLVNELSIDRSIANSVGDDIYSGQEYSFGVFQVIDMRCYPKTGGMGFLDDGFINFRLHLRRSSQQVVHPDFYEIGMAGNDFSDRSSGFFACLGTIELITTNW